jgi:hypothetical protein
MKEIHAEEIKGNLIEIINKQWALVTAGDREKANTMTVSWGSFGEFWSKPVVTIYIRPQRYTKEFIDANDRFSVCVLPETYKKALTYCGTVSGRDTDDKFQDAGITLDFCGDVPVIKEAGMTMICRKLCEGDINPDTFANPEDDKIVYPNKDYHRYYIAEIETVYVSEEYEC